MIILEGKTEIWEQEGGYCASAVDIDGESLTGVDELLKSEVVKENVCGWSMSNDVTMEISNCTFNGETR